MSPPALSDRRNATIALAFAGVLACALALRFGFLEAPALSRSCGASQEGLCGIRSWLGLVFNHKALGLASLIFGMIAYVTGRRRAAGLGLLLGTAGLVLYDFDYAAAGTLLALMALAG